MRTKNLDYKITWVGLLEIRDRKILMTRERGNDLFQLPGGGQKEGESFEDALEREVKEELGVEIKAIQAYDDFIVIGKNEGVLIRFLIFTASTDSDVKKGESIEEIKWIDSNYGKDSINIGNPTKLKLIPRLVDENLID